MVGINNCHHFMFYRINCVIFCNARTEHDAFYKQIIWIGISLFVMVIFTVIDYEAIVKGIADFLYSIFNFISSGTFYKAS